MALIVRVLVSACVFAASSLGLEGCGLEAYDVASLERTWIGTQGIPSPFRGKTQAKAERAELGNFLVFQIEGVQALFVLDTKSIFRKWSSTSLKYRSVVQALTPFFWLYQRANETELWTRLGRREFDVLDRSTFADLPALQWKPCGIEWSDRLSLPLEKSRQELLTHLIRSQVIVYLHESGYEFKELSLRMLSPMLLA